MKVYLDTNVFLDMIVPRDNRQDNVNALLLLKLAGTGKFRFCINPVTVSTAYYVLRKDSRRLKTHSKDARIPERRARCGR